MCDIYLSFVHFQDAISATIAALMAHDLQVHRIEIDCFASEFHEWPIVTDRNTDVRHVRGDRLVGGAKARILSLPRAARARVGRVIRSSNVSS